MLALEETFILIGCLFTELGFRFGLQVGFSSWIFEFDFRVRSFWPFFFFSDNVLNQRCCSSSRDLFKVKEKENCKFNLS